MHLDDIFDMFANFITKDAERVFGSEFGVGFEWDWGLNGLGAFMVDVVGLLEEVAQYNWVV